MTLSGSTLSNNQGGTGGGLYLLTDAGGSVTMTDSTVTGNEAASGASGSGGGLWIQNRSSDIPFSINSTNSVISQNTASAHGGGMAVWGGSGTFTFNLEGSTVTENTAEANGGGAVISANGTASISFRQDTIEKNTASDSGGGLYINTANGTILLTDSTKITYNHADVRESDFGNHGGGIYNDLGGIVTLTAGSIYGNHANVGGGIYNESDSIIRMNGSTLFGKEAPNEADSYGSGIYNEGQLYTAGNQDIENGIYIENSNAIVLLEDSLDNNAIIQLDPTDYVTPNLQGNPIVVAESTETYPLLSQTDANAFRKPSVGFDGWEIQLSHDRTQILLVPVYYTISYNANAACCPPAHCLPSSASVQSGGTLLLSCRKPIRKGYWFLGWNTEPDGSGISYLPGGTITNVTADIQLYAIWEKCCHCC